MIFGLVRLRHRNLNPSFLCIFSRLIWGLRRPRVFVRFSCHVAHRSKSRLSYHEHHGNLHVSQFNKKSQFLGNPDLTLGLVDTMWRTAQCLEIFDIVEWENEECWILTIRWISWPCILNTRIRNSSLCVLTSKNRIFSQSNPLNLSSTLLWRT